MYSKKLTTRSMSSFRVSLSSMKFCIPRVINSYSANKIAKLAHAKTKMCKYPKICKVENNYSSPNLNFKLV